MNAITKKFDIFGNSKDFLQTPFGEFTLGASPLFDAMGMAIAHHLTGNSLEDLFSAFAEADKGRAQKALIAMGEDAFSSEFGAWLREKAAANQAAAIMNRFNPSFMKVCKFGAGAEDASDGFAQGLRRCVGL